MRQLFSILILTCCNSTALAQDAPDVCNDGKCVQVGSYNIEFFGGTREPYDGTQRGPRTDAQIENLANRISKDLDLEVAVFQEINTDSPEWARFKELLNSQGYQFFEGTASDTNQFVAIAWDSDEVQLQDNSAREFDFRNNFDFGDGCAVSGQRKPVAARLKAGEFDFWIVGVHLKSRRGDTACSDRVRTEQCKELVHDIEELITSSGERDVLIVGDLNNRIGHGTLRPLADAGFVPQMRFLMPQSAKGSYVKTDSPSDSTDLIDHVMLRYRDTREVVRNSACVMKLSSPEEAKKYIIEQSDHVPVWVSFRTDADLD